MNRRLRLQIVAWFVSALAAWPTAALAQRSISWDTLEVTAHLEADGSLRVVETHAMVFTGDWNGGERTFNIRPRQSISMEGLFRVDSDGRKELGLDASLDDVDEYGWEESRLRWRSRRPTDPPFARTPLRYEIRYRLSGILIEEGGEYRLDHDFAFPDRESPIGRFSLRLTLDPAWLPSVDVRPIYTAGPLPPGRGYVLTVPLRYGGAGRPAALDTARPPEITGGVMALLTIAPLAILLLFVRERSVGRFAPLTTTIDEAWLQTHVLSHRPEVVAAAWDEGTGSPEVVALISRLVGEGILASTVGKGKGAYASLSLTLKADRESLTGYERALVDALFFDGPTTSTNAVKAHYKATGFNPAQIIKKDLGAAVDRAFPLGAPVRAAGLLATGLLLVGLGCFFLALRNGQSIPWQPLLVVLGFSFAGWVAGFIFRANLALGIRAAVVCLVPAVAVALGVSYYLWSYAGEGYVELDAMAVWGFAALGLASVLSMVDAMMTRRSRAGLAAIKNLAAAREHFARELKTGRPAIRDEWYPWLLAFELGGLVDSWSVAHAGTGRGDGWRHSSTVSSGSSSTGGDWAGFSGGRSGGGGGGASWQAAAGGLAAGVAAPSSSGSSGSGSSGSSGGGSSGGGGGGGW